MDIQNQPQNQPRSQPQGQFPVQPKPKKPWYKKWWIWVILGVASTSVFYGISAATGNIKSPGNSSSAKETTPPTTVSISQVEKKTEPETETEIKTEPKATQAAEAATEAVTQSQESVLFEQNGIKIVYKGLGTSWMGQTVELRIENTSNKNYTVQTRDVSVNGFMVNEMFSCDVNSGKTANDEITFLKSDFEKNGIEKIKNIELTFHVFNADDWEDSFNSQPLSIAF